MASTKADEELSWWSARLLQASEADEVEKMSKK